MAKGPSPQKAKMAAYRARPYTDRQRMAYENCDCDSGGAIPPPWVRDAAADRALDGGFRTVTKKGVNNVCPTCFCARSVNGTCGC